MQSERLLIAVSPRSEMAGFCPASIPWWLSFFPGKRVRT
jgi:hypothetical protein